MAVELYVPFLFSMPNGNIGHAWSVVRADNDPESSADVFEIYGFIQKMLFAKHGVICEVTPLLWRVLRQVPKDEKLHGLIILTG